MILLKIGLIFSLLIYVWRIFGWVRSSFLWLTKPESDVIRNLEETFKQKKWLFIVGGIEHLIIFASLLASFLLL